MNKSINAIIVNENKVDRCFQKHNENFVLFDEFEVNKTRNRNVCIDEQNVFLIFVECQNLNIKVELIVV